MGGGPERDFSVNTYTQAYRKVPPKARNRPKKKEVPASVDELSDPNALMESPAKMMSNESHWLVPRFFRINILLNKAVNTTTLEYTT